MDATTPTGIATTNDIAEAQAAYTTWRRFQTRLEPMAMEAFRDMQSLIRTGCFTVGVPETAYKMYGHPINKWLAKVSYVSFDTDEGVFIAHSNDLDDHDDGGALTIVQVLDPESRTRLADNLVERAYELWLATERRKEHADRDRNIRELRRLAALYPEEVPHA